MPPPNRLLPARPLGRSSFERMKHRRLSALSPCAADNFVPWPPLHRASLFAREYRRAFATLTVFKLFFPPPPPFSFFLNISLFSSIFLICLFIYFFFFIIICHSFLERFSRYSNSNPDSNPVLLRRFSRRRNVNNEKLLDTLRIAVAKRSVLTIFFQTEKIWKEIERSSDGQI